MSTLKLSLLLSLVLGLNACSQFQAFEDRRREPGTEYVYVGASKPDAPALCYNPLWEKDTTLQEKADALCQKTNPATVAELVGKDYFTCRLFVPSKAYYKCVAK
ncbi:MAG: hypothetical protein NC218_04650 [Acetobacter sp.]|nr:hypothetical protein [Acetobacter sp.]